MRAAAEGFLVHLTRWTTRYRPDIAALRAALAANPLTRCRDCCRRCASLRLPPGCELPAGWPVVVTGAGVSGVL